MTWLNNGNILQIENENDSKLVSISLKEYDEDFTKLATSYGQIFNLLLEDTSRADQACDKYLDLFKDTHTEESDFCYLCFNLIKLLFFTSEQKNIRSQVIKLIKYTRFFPNENILIDLLCDLFVSPADFHDNYIKNGGTELIYNQIIQYNESDTTDKWISQIDSVFQNSSSQFDTQFCQFIDSRDIKCKNYLLSVILTNFINHKKTTAQNLLNTGSRILIRTSKKESLENEFFWGLFNKQFSICCKYIYPKTNDMIFTVHFLHLLTLASLTSDEKEVINLKRELDSAIFRYIEFIMSDYDENQETGLRKWVPPYLNIINQDIRLAIQRILPAIKPGLQGSYIDSVQKLQQFTFIDDSEYLSLFYRIKKLVKKLGEIEIESNEAILLEEIVKMLNDSYIKCDDKIKLDILLQITPYLEKFDGLSGPVISCMIDIGNYYSASKDNDPCPALQKMLYDIILETGDVPEFLIK